MGIVQLVSFLGTVAFVIAFILIVIHNSEEGKRKYKVFMVLAIAVLALNTFVVAPDGHGRVIKEDVYSPQLKYNEDGTIKHKSDGDYDLKYNYSEKVVGHTSPSLVANRMSWILMFLGIGLGVLSLMGISNSGNNQLKRINAFLQQGLLKLRGSTVMDKIYPYAKWVMYGCELFFLLSIFFVYSPAGGFAPLCDFIFIASIIVLYAFKDDKNLFYGASIYVGIRVIMIILNITRYGIYLYNLLYSLPPLIIFALIAYFARKRLRNMNTENVLQSAQAEKPVNKLIAAAPFVLVILIFAFSTASIAFSPQVRFDAAMEKGNVEKALAIYEKAPEKLNITSSAEKLKAAMTDLTDKYISGDMDYDNTMGHLKAMPNIEELKESVTEATDRINEIKASREAFDKAVAAEKDKDLVKAFGEYKKVVSKDKDNYAVAKDKIKKITPKLKKLAFAEIKKNIGKGDYIGAKKAVDKALITLPSDTELLNIQKDIDPQAKSILLASATEKANAGDFAGAETVIDEALTLFKDDRDFLNMKANVENVLYTAKVEKARTEQLVIVESAAVIVQKENLKELYPDTAEFLVKNLSDKVVKNFTVAYCGIDKDGKFVEIKTTNSKTAEIMKTLKSKGTKIQPSSTYKDNSVEFASDMSIIAIDACVKSVDFADGTTWENPYYKFWNEAYSSYINMAQQQSTSSPKKYSNSSGGSDSSSPSSSSRYSGGSSSKSNKTDDEESEFEKYLKENNQDSYDFYQELEEGWDNLQ